FTVIALVSVLLTPFLGVKNLSIEQIINNPQYMYVFLHYRIPRVLLGFVVGAVLSSAGLIFQSIFSNPLATPYTLGIASAASLGAVVAIYFKFTYSFGLIDPTMLTAILFSLVSIVMLYLISQKQKIYETNKILLLGVAMNFLCSSLILFFQFKIDYLNSFKILHWLIGSMQNISYDILIVITVISIFGISFIFRMRKELDLLSLGEEFALSKGVNVGYVRWLLIVVGSVLVGVCVAFFGPISFIGLIVPNIARMLIGAMHKHLIWGVMLLGGIIVVISDCLSRTMFRPVEIPLGVVTAFIGAIFFFYMLTKKDA
ncbi:MAG: hypothetical protein A2Y40_08230, partial [Candidatus Margulisbacteria bacterium GWF2_35_9]